MKAKLTSSAFFWNMGKVLKTRMDISETQVDSDTLCVYLLKVESSVPIASNEIVPSGSIGAPVVSVCIITITKPLG